jgi:hypothetical protein
VQVLLQARRLTVAKSLPFAPILADELRDFQVKITESANETFGAWRDGQHDDLVLAIVRGVGGRECAGGKSRALIGTGPVCGGVTFYDD